MEEWRDIEGYEGLYQISNLGRVKSLERIDGNNHPVKEKIIKPYKTIGGYIQICLWKNGKVKHFQIHRLVAQAFIPNPNNLPECNHKDENPLNNCADNIEWCDHKYNINYGTRTEKASEKMKGHIVLQETRKKIGEAQKGKKLSEEHKNILSKALTNRSDQSKPVLQIDKNTGQIIMEFPSAREVERQFGYSYGNISQCCNGKRKQAYGYKWQFKNG